MAAQVSEGSPLISPSSAKGKKAVDESYANLARINLFSGLQTWIAQISLLIALIIVLRITALHPAGLFSYHPALQIFAVVSFIQGILVLQPIGSSKVQKVYGLNLHQATQTIGLITAAVGVFIIWYNKKLHGANHFTSWHGKFGLITIVFVIFQAFAGFIASRNPGQTWLGESRAKSLWKWHRASGYINITLLFLTPALAIEYADWVVNNSSRAERTIAGLSLLVAWVSLITRLNPTKMQLLGNRNRK